MNPHLSSGVFTQSWWPGNGGRPYDDCWVLADLMAVHAVAPWVSLPNVIVYRREAGNPDEPNVPDGGTIDQSYRAMKRLWPELAAKITVLKNVSWADFEAKITKDRTASLSVLSSALPLSHQYGFKGTHRVAVAKVDSGWLSANPLAAPHARYRTITEAALKKAALDYPTPGVNAIVMPSVAAAFKTHPLHP
jgi:hypothetical protein